MLFAQILFKNVTNILVSWGEARKNDFKYILFNDLSTKFLWNAFMNKSCVFY